MGIGWHVESSGAEGVVGGMPIDGDADTEEAFGDGLNFNGIAKFERGAEMLEVVCAAIVFDEEVINVIDDEDGGTSGMVEETWGMAAHDITVSL